MIRENTSIDVGTSLICTYSKFLSSKISLILSLPETNLLLRRFIGLILLGGFESVVRPRVTIADVILCTVGSNELRFQFCNDLVPTAVL